MRPSVPPLEPARWETLPPANRFKNRLIYLVVRAALFVAVHLPGRWAIGWGAWLGRTAGRLARGERRRTEAHLAEAFGRAPDAPETRRLARAVFEHLGRSAGELAWAWRSPERVRRLVRFAPGSLETMQRLTAGGRGVLFVTGHLGNWELLAWAIQVAGIPSGAVGRQSYDERLTELIGRWRGRWGARVLWREDPEVGRGILAAVGAGVSIGLLLDQATDLACCPVTFFGRPARTTIRPAQLALGQGLTVVTGRSRRGPDGVHELLIEESPPPPPEAEDPAAAWTERWSETLERYIREAPEQWVWMHDRWRLPRFELDAGAVQGEVDSAGSSARAGAPAAASAGASIMSSSARARES